MEEKEVEKEVDEEKEEKEQVYVTLTYVSDSNQQFFSLYYTFTCMSYCISLA